MIIGTVSIGMVLAIIFERGKEFILFFGWLFIIVSIADLIKRKKAGEKYSDVLGLFEEWYGRAFATFLAWTIALLSIVGFLVFTLVNFIWK
ncbi:MAG: hypothetical protein HYX62_07095 [Gammaproteobacteria bacterium]|nr:hypothetical protein [Gammaproteobacteria bacterium]